MTATVHIANHSLMPHKVYLVCLLKCLSLFIFLCYRVIVLLL